MKVNLDEWKITQEEFNKWILDTGAMVQPVHKHNTSVLYRVNEFILDEEADYLAFILKFKFKTDRDGMDTAYFYCPYIPLMTVSGVIKTNESC